LIILISRKAFYTRAKTSSIQLISTATSSGTITKLKYNTSGTKLTYILVYISFYLSAFLNQNAGFSALISITDKISIGNTELIIFNIPTEGSWA